MTGRRVLVTCGEQRAALAVVRSLGRAGHRVHVVSPAARPLAAASRWCVDSARTPDPLDAPGDFAAEVRARAARWDADVLLPVTEGAILALTAPGAAPPGVLLPLPPAAAFRAVCDKRRVLDEAARLGIAVPAQTVLARPEDRAALVPGAVAFPVVIKPARSVAGVDGARVKTSVAHAADWVQLHTRLDAVPRAAYPVLLQQRITGPGTGIFLLLWDDAVRAVFAHRRVREKPPSGGVAVLGESVAPDPALVARGAELLRRFGWRGVAMLEFKCDSATGTPYLMEVNGRFWGSLQLAVDAGVDFPALLVDAAAGEPARPLPAWRPGVRTRWWWGEVDHLLTRLRRSPAALDLPADAPGRGRALLDFALACGPGARSETLHASDPRPFLRESLAWFRGG